MVTLFSCPKAFGNTRIASIQTNAIQSWRCLGSQVEVVLCGSDLGVAEASARVNARHLPDLAVNDRGTPFVDDMFRKACAAASHPILCYINADIILFQDFVEAIALTSRSFEDFLMIGRRWGLQGEVPIDFGDPLWAGKLRQAVLAQGDPHPAALDYFAFTKRSVANLPPFLIGRPGWDNWLVSDALRRRIPVVDASQAVLAVHPAHDYDHVGGIISYRDGAEARHNRALLDENTYSGTTDYANYYLLRGKVKSAFWRRLRTGAKHLAWHWLITRTTRVRRAFGLRRRPMSNLGSKI